MKTSTILVTYFTGLFAVCPYCFQYVRVEDDNGVPCKKQLCPICWKHYWLKP